MLRLPIDYKIETSRCIIEMPIKFDAKDYYNLVDTWVTEFMHWNRLESIGAYEKFIEEKRQNWETQRWFESIVRLKETWEMIWCFGIVEYDFNVKYIEIWYWIWSRFWWKGYIPECVEKMKEISFEVIWCEKIVIRATKENMKSRRVAEKCGFTLDGVLRKGDFIKWEFVDRVEYSFLREEWENSKL